MSVGPDTLLKLLVLDGNESGKSSVEQKPIAERICFSVGLMGWTFAKEHGPREGVDMTLQHVDHTSQLCKVFTCDGSMLAQVQTSFHMVTEPSIDHGIIEQIQQVLGEVVASMGQIMIQVLQQHSAWQQQPAGTLAQTAHNAASEKAAAERKMFRDL